MGAANATAAGWGNLGGGVTNALTPVVFNIFMAATNKDIDRAWRLTFLLPLAMHVITSFIVLSGRDLPDGQFKELEQSGAKQKGDSSIVIKVGISTTSRQVGSVSVGVNVFPPAAGSSVPPIAKDCPTYAAMCGHGLNQGIVDNYWSMLVKYFHYSSRLF